MATQGDSALRQPHSTAAAIDHSVQSSLSDLGDSVAQAGPAWHVPEVDLSEGHSHGASQVSEAVSGQIRNAASAAFSSKSIEGESAFSQNVDACSISHKGGSKLRKRLSSAEEMSARRFDVKPDQSGLSQSQHPPQRRNQNASSGRAYEMTAGRELGGSGSHHAQLLHQMSIPSNVAIDISSRGGGTSISQVAQGQNFQTGAELEVEMPKPQQQLMHGHPGSSANAQQLSNPRQNPDLASPCEASRPRNDVEYGNEDQFDIQASVSVTQRGKEESLSTPLQSLLAIAPTMSTAHILSPQKSLRHSLQAVMEMTLNSMRGGEAPGGSASRNNGEVSFGFALPPGPLLTPGTIHAAANSGCMVASAHGTVIPDDVVSDADTEVALLHRRHQDQGHHQNGPVNSLANERTESDRSVSQGHRPAITVHTVVGSVEEELGNQQDQANGNNSTVNRQPSLYSGNPSTVNMSDKADEKVPNEAADEMLDTAQSEKSDERSDGESPKSVTGIRQGSTSGVGRGASLGQKEDNADNCTGTGAGMKETNEKSSAVHDQPQSLHNSSEKKHALKSRISRSDSIGSQCRKRKHPSSTSPLNKSGQ